MTPFPNLGLLTLSVLCLIAWFGSVAAVMEVRASDFSGSTSPTPPPASRSSSLLGLLISVDSFRFFVAMEVCNHRGAIYGRLRGQIGPEFGVSCFGKSKASIGSFRFCPFWSYRGMNSVTKTKTPIFFLVNTDTRT